jgi:uncharacterized membrane protein YgcG
MDAFGATVKLKLMGNNQDKNLIGAFISLFMMAASIAMTMPTLLNYILAQNPSVTNSIIYDIPYLNFNLDNFYFSISFFEPKDENIADASADNNDYKKIGFINQLNITCSTCNKGYSKSARMNLCNKEQFGDSTMSIKSLSKKKTKNILSIFSNYSFCFPDDMIGTIEDNDDVTSPYESTLQVYIPVNNVSYEFAGVERNDKVAASLAINTPSAPSVPITTQSTAPIPSSSSGSVPSNGSNQNGQSGSSTSGGTRGGGSSTSSGGGSPTVVIINNGNGNGNTNCDPNIDPTCTDNANNNGGDGCDMETGEGCNWGDNTNNNGCDMNTGEGCNTNNNGCDMETGEGCNTDNNGCDMNTGVGCDANTDNGCDMNTGVGCDANTDNGCDMNTGVGCDANTDNGCDMNTGVGCRLLQEIKQTVQNKPVRKNTKTNSKTRNLQTSSTTSSSSSSSTANKTTTSTIDSSQIYDLLQNDIFEHNRFPKMLFIHRSIEISSKKISEKDIINEIYFMDIVDYRDPLTGRPVVYDIFVQKYIVSIDRGNFFGGTDDTEFLIIEKIERNTIDSISREGAFLSFKMSPDGQQINVKYVSFTDVLGVFGSFYSIFSLVAGILSSLYNEVFLTRKLVNSIFKFIDNEPDNFGKKNNRENELASVGKPFGNGASVSDDNCSK